LQVSTIVYLVRHADHDLVNRVLVGRNGAVGLSRRGFTQAEGLAAHFVRRRVTAVQSSPQLRARQTAQATAAALGLPFLIVSAADELDCGGWTGRSFVELGRDPAWHRWNEARGISRVPGGESMGEVQRRIVDHLASLAIDQSNRRVILITHAEVIRAAVLHFRNVSLDDFAQVQVDPASVTTVRMTLRGGEVVRANQLLDVAVAA
jgi:broad specificity phosphatase PhoE